MAGYSGTPLHQKLGFKPGMKAHLIGAVYKAPAGITTQSKPSGPLDFVHVFTKEKVDLERRFPVLKEALAPAGMLWVSWPKGASKVKTDLNENVVREIGLQAGLVDVKVCAVDEVWSGLKFVRRLKDR
ncbi:MAG TPA: DUF3052 domain-containing protein [Planctomycetota bacterium]|jgi:hypothetical protein|nr:DUF3052 domain-containing protein [Planctomycetota bacterium]